MTKNTKKSIVQAESDRCFFCGRNGSADRLEKHHIFGGANRRKSEEDGLYVMLCGDRCHRNGPWSAHQNAECAELLHKVGQKAWEKRYGMRVDFMSRYRKNYLEDDE